MPLVRSFVALVIACSALSVATVAIAQEDEDSPFRSGLVAAYAAGPVTTTRVDEVVAFDWQDAAPDPRLPAGEFSATWRGKLWTKSSGQHRLLCYARGDVKVELLGRTVIEGQAAEPTWLRSEPIELEFGRHDLVITFRKTAPSAQLALFWSGPDFRLEPIPERALLHDREGSPASDFERGRQLSAALRCAACHQDESAEVVPAPALDRLTGNIAEPWLIEWLSSHMARDSAAGTPATESRATSLRRMPDLAMTKDEATAVAAWLLREPAVKIESKSLERKDNDDSDTKKKGKKAKGEPEKPKPSAAEGERLLLTRGCLACHQLGTLGESGLFGGGDLAALLSKRPVDFLVRWLDDPAAINRSHRMPVFSFSADETKSLSLWAKEAAEKSKSPAAAKQSKDRELIRQGEKLVGTFRCANCHIVSRDKDELASAPLAALQAKSDWTKSCSGAPDRAKQRPGYRLAPADQAALKAHYSQPRPGAEKLSPQARGRDLLVQLNCLACHQREGVDRTANSLPARLQDKLVAVAETHDQLAPLVPAMTPPALNSVGDKLLDAALADSISRQGPPHRPYLLVQMPKFKLKQEQLAALTAYFTATDRIPQSSPHAPREGLVSRSETATHETPTPQLLAAGPRLVTTDGLACTSCHQIGSVPPAKAPLNARGPTLSMLEKRIRREWFDRWCDNPARIVPRMEMPSVKVPIRGVLNEKIDDQLAAVWHILNTPGFEPPEPNPVRVLRLSGVPERNERPIVIHDVMKDGDKTYLFPLVIGLPNRHNILFDLETNRLAAWWLGDTARQRTKGKSWYWETGGKSIYSMSGDSELSLVMDGKDYQPIAAEQFTASLDNTISEAFKAFSSVDFGTHLAFRTDAELPMQNISVMQKLEMPGISPSSGFERRIVVANAPRGAAIRLRLVDRNQCAEGSWDPTKQIFQAGDERFWIRIDRPTRVQWNGDGSITIKGAELFPGAPPEITHWLNLTYGAALPSDQYLVESPPVAKPEAKPLEIAPGFHAQRLPLSDDIMPSAFAFKSDGSLVFPTLKGEVFLAQDQNSDGLEENLVLIADGLATPYGVHVADNEPDNILVAAKAGLLSVKLIDDGNDTQKAVATIVASGWGHTDDYHDWAVGPVPGDDGEYFIALPCQQDQRNDHAAKYRGKLIKLVPINRQPDESKLFDVEKSRQFDIEVVSSGHRFPMGMARNRDGELFVTDNQGNYNPFNELNHVRKGAHFGFINALEKEQGFKAPPLDEPAIDIPHPWTRSVNGICFLETPAQLAGTKPGPGEAPKRVAGGAPGAGLLPAKALYGPLEGHLVGCEYDTRRLIRMSLQKVGDTYQGAAYPLSIPTEDVEKGLLGPIVCAIKPTTGELYVGEIRDSGWGAGNNIGQIVKIKIEPEKLPCGIAEVRATATGFTIDFFQPVEQTKAADAASYSISSYRRESTPAYGGSDIDRRTESISKVEIAESGQRVTLTLPDLRAGHAYELKLKNLTPGGGMFHPDEAHYTLRKIPQ